MEVLTSRIEESEIMFYLEILSSFSKVLSKVSNNCIQYPAHMQQTTLQFQLST